MRLNFLRKFIAIFYLSVSIGKSYRFSATEIYTLTLVAIAELKTKRINRVNSELWKQRNFAQKSITETEFNTRNRNVTLNWKCKTELCAEIHSSGIIKTLIDHCYSIEFQNCGIITWNWIAERKTNSEWTLKNWNITVTNNV